MITGLLLVSKGREIYIYIHIYVCVQPFRDSSNVTIAIQAVSQTWETLFLFFRIFFFLPFSYSNPIFAINEYKLRTKKKWSFISIDIVVAIIYFKFLLVLQVRLKEIILK